MKAIRPKQFRLHIWLNTETRKEEYGIQAKIDGNWTHCSEDGKPLIFPDRGDARAKMMDLCNGNPYGTLKLPRVV